MSKLVLSLAVATFAIVALMGCSVETKQPQSSGVSEEKYNELVRNYNSTVSSAHALQLNSSELNDKLIELDRSIVDFNSDIKANETLTVCYPANLAAFRKKYENVIAIIHQLEVLTRQQYIKLISNADNVFQSPAAQKQYLETQRGNFAIQGNSLDGIRTLVTNAYLAAVKADLAKYTGAVQSCATSTAARPVVEKQIELTSEETIVSQTTSNGGFYRQNGKVVVLNSAQAVEQNAISLGLSSQAARSSFQMSNSTGGVVGLAKSSDDLAQTIQDMFGHIKAQINSNTDDLEVVFAIDYSGSMSDDIRSVITNLTKITQSLVAVQKSGRNVKIGITTFGLIGRESVNLNLTSDLSQVSIVLKDLLDNYDREQHSDDPGEGSYSGLRLAADRIVWSSQNRKIILITDEPSKEIEMKMDTVINQAQAALKRNSVQTSIYTIVVGR